MNHNRDQHENELTSSGGRRSEVGLTAHVGAVDERFAPRAAALVLVGSNPELVRRVGLQVVDDRVAGRARLVVPLPAPLPVPDGVEPAGQTGLLQVTFFLWS